MENKLLELYNQYIKMFDLDLLFKTFFDKESEKNVEEKIKALKYCIDNEKNFVNVKDYEKLLDKYPKTDRWDL